MKTCSTVLILASLILFASCGNHKPAKVHVSGKITDAAGKLLKLQELDVDYSTNLDSLELDPDGQFEFKPDLRETGLYLIRIADHIPLVIELKPGDSVKIRSAARTFPWQAAISGSPSSRDLLEFYNLSAVNKTKYDSLKKILESRQDEKDFNLLSRQMDDQVKLLWDKQREMEMQYIDNHLLSLTSLLVLNHGLSLSPVLTFATDSVYFLKLDSALDKVYPGNKHAVSHHQRIIRQREKMRPQKN